MVKISDTVTEIKWDDNNFYIFCDENKLKCDVVNGEVNVNIYDKNNNNIYINKLNIGDLIIIEYNKLSENYIIPIEITINDKYEFYDTSDDDYY